jgi:hypothetical protein
MVAVVAVVLWLSRKEASPSAAFQPVVAPRHVARLARALTPPRLGIPAPPA